MLPERYRRLWRRRLRRRPLLAWLLVGTVAFDAAGCVVFYNDWEVALLYGVFLGQMCLLSVWGVSSRAGLLGRLLAIVCADCLIGTLFSPGIRPIDISSSIAWCLGVTAAGSPVALLGIASQRLQAGFRELPEGMSLVIHPRRPTITPRLWRGGRWNIGTLLGMTSLVAVLTAAVGTADFTEVVESLLEEIRTLLFLTVTVVTGIAIAARQAIGNWTVCGVAVGVAAAASFLLTGPFDLLFGPGYFAGVTLISLAWLVGLRVRPALPSA